MGQKSTWELEWMFNTSELVAVTAISLLLQQRCYFTFWHWNIDGWIPSLPTEVQSHLLHLHSLFELIPGPSDRLCISTFDLIGFLMQQLLPVLLRPAHLADPGSWRASKHRESCIMGGFINLGGGWGHTVHSSWIARALATVPLAHNDDQLLSTK